MKNSQSRTKKIAKNVTASIIGNLVSLVCGLILPRLILTNFGSEYNGVTQSITQFISYISLMQSGIGGATIAALYKPLANDDNREISEIIASTQKYMRKIAFIFVAFSLGLAIVYPLFIVKDFDFLFTSSLIVIISLSTFAEYYFGFTYRCLIEADQKGYIIYHLHSITVLLNAVLSVILIRNNCSIHVVKLGASLVNIISPLFYFFYVKKKYKIIEKIEVTEDKIPQKWNAAVHEIAAFVNNNTDIVILTIFATLKDVSVYTVYHYVTSSIKKIVTNFTVGFGHAFGDMYAKNEIDLMNKNLGIYEVIIYSLTTIFCGVTMAMMIPFVLLYTKGVNDIEYSRPLFSIIMILALAFNCFRVPYRSIVYAIGHYKQTRNGALFEAIMNIVISVSVVIKFGLVGVAVGTLFAMAFRTFQYAIYLSKNIINRDIKYFLMHIVVSLSVTFIVYFISNIYMGIITSWLSWIMYSILTTLITTIITILTNLLFFKEDFVNTVTKMKTLIIRKF